LLFAAGGIFLLWQMASGGRVLSAITTWAARSPKPKAASLPKPGAALIGLLGRFQRRSQRTRSRGVFPRILDQYVVVEFLKTFFLVLAAFALLMLVFTTFDLLADILRNHIALTTVGLYLINLTPTMLYQLAPLAVLVAVLVTFGALNRNSEIIAMKATGISLYRLVVPIVAISAILAISLFLFDQYYLPLANQRQEALRDIIKGRPPRTFLHPEQTWIFGQPHPGEPARIFHYQYFDPYLSEFANLSLFEFDPSTFALSRRIFAARVVWNPESSSWRFLDGWQHDIEGGKVSDYHEFKETSFSEIHEDPGYFTKEEKQAQEMNFGQLDRYIGDLRQSGFDTMRLRVQLWHKLAYPLIAVVMAVLAIPFALSMGRRGSLTGVAVAIAVALAYFVVNALFESMGNVNYLPAALAAWSPDILFGLTGGYLLLRTPT
jgi:LPS export ABC transporter permease LptG